MASLPEYAQASTEGVVGLVKELVERESPTSSKEGNDAVAEVVGNALADLGLSVERRRQATAGDHLLARWGHGAGDGGGAGQAALVLCHMDTVWPLGTILHRPFRRSQRALHGPGVFDMKGSIACTIFAVKALRGLGLEPRRPLTLLFNSDEEVGSPTSRGLIEAEARRSAHCLVMEAAEGPRGNLKTRRKGVAAFTVRIVGEAAHASLSQARGVSAVEEMAYQVLRIHALARPEAGTTVNVGLVQGGIARNVVAPVAEAQVDVRVASQEEARRVEEALLALDPVLPGARVEVTGGLTRPPMEPTPLAEALFQRACRIAASHLGMELKDGMTGGGSDGQFAAAVGCPTLDGLGVLGSGAHAAREFTVLRSLPERTALLATLLLHL